MQSDANRKSITEPHRIELNLRDVKQLFNTMDPSPFREKDLDGDAEEFIVNWVQEFPLEDEAVLVVHLTEFPEQDDPQILIEQAVHHYFAYRARLNQMEFRKLRKQGRQSLLIGLAFLGVCLLLSEVVARPESGTFAEIVRESLTIG